MSEENTGNQQETNTAENIEELKQKIATLEQERDNVVGELKDDRQKRQDLQSEVDSLKQSLEEATKANTAAPAADDVNSQVSRIVEQKLQEQNASIAKGNKKAAIERFVNEHKEFHSDNDTTGKRKEALESAFSRFNTEGMVTEADFYSVVKDAYRLLGADTAPSNPSEEKPDLPSGPTPSSQPKTVDSSNYTEKEKKLMEKNNMSAERFDALKARDPDYIQNLLQYFD